MWGARAGGGAQLSSIEASPVFFLCEASCRSTFSDFFCLADTQLPEMANVRRLAAPPADCTLPSPELAKLSEAVPLSSEACVSRPAAQHKAAALQEVSRHEDGEGDWCPGGDGRTAAGQ